MKGINQRVKEFRKAKGLNQEDFAEKLNVTQSAISALERGGGVSFEIFTNLIDIFEANPWWLLKGIEPMTCKAPGNEETSSNTEWKELREQLDRMGKELEGIRKIVDEKEK